MGTSVAPAARAGTSSRESAVKVTGDQSGSDAPGLGSSDKDRLRETKETDTALLLTTILNPIRCMKNKLADECLAIEAEGADFEKIITTVAGGKGQVAYNTGDPDAAPIACGQIAGLIDNIKSVQEVVDDIISEADTLHERLNGLRTN